MPEDPSAWERARTLVTPAPVTVTITEPSLMCRGRIVDGDCQRAEQPTKILACPPMPWPFTLSAPHDARHHSEEAHGIGERPDAAGGAVINGGHVDFDHMELVVTCLDEEFRFEVVPA